MHEPFAGLQADGKTTPRGAPKSPPQLGATVWHFRHESRATSPPIWLKDLILPPLWGRWPRSWACPPTTPNGTAGKPRDRGPPHEDPRPDDRDRERQARTEL